MTRAYVTRTYLVPGRVELVGKHVDYAGGRSLTCAIGPALHVRATPLAEPVVTARDASRREKVHVRLAADAKPGRVRWSAYVAAVARRFARDFPHARTGVEIEMTSDLPASAGLSSSSALVVAIATALVDANAMERDDAWRAAVPDAVQRAEYFAAMETGAPYGPFAGDRGVGVRGGAQDHVAIVCAEEGSVGQFRYLPARLERRVRWPADLALVVAVSGVHATKTGNARDAYNRLADAMCALGPGGSKFASDPVMSARLGQFHQESDVIVPGVGDALRDRDYARIGELADRSQSLAERVLGNQVPETIFLARSARERGAIAASAFGAGFGGAVWAMVTRDAADAFAEGWRAAYGAAFPSRRASAQFIVTRPAGPAREVAGA
ncbi:MAG TPA: galactokinase family protein [Gemmatimonadaceae bacterium]|nr:galactokinase family protein [Gemmatimonadaceae bacterium]